MQAPRSSSSPLLWALVPVAAVGVPVGAVAVYQSPPAVHAICFLMAILPLGFCWLGLSALPFLRLEPFHPLNRALPALRTRLGGRIEAGTGLRVAIDGIDVEIGVATVRLGYRRYRAVPRVAVRTPGSWSVIGLAKPSDPSHPEAVPTGDGRLDDRFAWLCDRPEQAAAWLSDPEVRRCWTALLTAGPTGDHGIDAVAREVDTLVRLRRALPGDGGRSSPIH